MPLIEAKDLHKVYETQSKPLEVLRGVDFTIEAGEALAIVGASGTGKSTLLHILGTLDKPSRGQLTFEGINLLAMSENRLSEHRNCNMGFVFQFHHLLPMLDALENAMLPGMIAGFSKKEAAERARENLEKVGLGQRLMHRPAELSGGEQQRVAIARALMMQPKILFADEPTGNLDSHSGEEVADLLLSLREQQGMSLVIVTHNEKLAMRLPRCLTMLDGQLKK